MLRVFKIKVKTILYNYCFRGTSDLFDKLKENTYTLQMMKSFYLFIYFFFFFNYIKNGKCNYLTVYIYVI